MGWRKENSLVLFGLLAGFLIGPAMAEPLDGVWRSEGYGYVFQVQGPKWTSFEVTQTTCVPGFTAQRTGGREADRDASFEANGARRFLVRPAAPSATRRVLHFQGAASDMRMDRIARMPSVCDRVTANTPQGNFEVFSKTWAENYISFGLRHVDWPKVVAKARAQLSSATTPGHLYAIMLGMIAPLGDAHTRLKAPDLGKSFMGFRLNTQPDVPAVFRTTDRLYFHEPVQRFCNDQVLYGHVDANIGYLRLLSFENYTPKGDFDSELACFDPAMDKIFSDGSIKGLIIDLRVNTGGADPLGLALASRLANGRYLAYAKEARADPVDRDKWTEKDFDYVSPSTRAGFHGPVVELIGRSTVSAGETFTQALMGRTPHVIRIGENTQGVFSDILTRRLRNGWTFGLPNEVFLTADGKAFDGDGIPPDIRVPVFAADSGRDAAMAEALKQLRGTAH